MSSEETLPEKKLYLRFLYKTPLYTEFVESPAGTAPPFHATYMDNNFVYTEKSKYSKFYIPGGVETVWKNVN
jgi:hypothetical protein